MIAAHPQQLKCKLNLALDLAAVSFHINTTDYMCFAGRALSSEAQLLLRNVSRYAAGKYQCVAFNYVPGSVSNEADVTVHYPPGEVTITNTRNSLVCSTAGGSLPAPFYSWLLPNGNAWILLEIVDRRNEVIAFCRNYDHQKYIGSTDFVFGYKSSRVVRMSCPQ